MSTDEGPKSTEDDTKNTEDDASIKRKGVRFSAPPLDDVQEEIAAGSEINLAPAPPQPPPLPAKPITRPRSPQRSGGPPKLVGFMPFSQSIEQKSKEFEERRNKLDASAAQEQKEDAQEELLVVNNPNPTPNPDPDPDPDIDSDLDRALDSDSAPDPNMVGVTIGENQTAGQTRDLDPHLASMEALNVKSVRLYADKANLDFEKLKNQVEMALNETMPERIAGFGEPTDIMSDSQYELYQARFMENPLEDLGEKLQQSNPQEALELLDFLIKGAKRECVESSPEGGETPTDVKAKLMALEEVRKALTLVVRLDYNNVRYKEFSEVMAKVNVILLKTNILEEQKNLFNSRLSSGLAVHRYTEHSALARGKIYSQSKGKMVNRWAHVVKNADRGKDEFRPNAESMNHTSGPSKKRYIADNIFHRNTASNYHNIKISHSNFGQVIHLSFGFDRKDVLKGDKYAIAKMQQQTADALFIAMTGFVPALDKIPAGAKIEDYMKGGEMNPLVFKDRPPEIKQPETTISMLEALKHRAIEEGKSFYVIDPSDPTKKVTITPSTTYSPEELACFSKLADETPTHPKAREVESAGKILYDVEPGNTEALKEKLEKRAQDFVKNNKDKTDKKLDKVFNEYSADKKSKPKH